MIRIRDESLPVESQTRINFRLLHSIGAWEAVRFEIGESLNGPQESFSGDRCEIEKVFSENRVHCRYPVPNGNPVKALMN